MLQAAGVLAGLRHRGDRLVGPCPIHGGDNPTAFSVDLRLNRWYCFTGCSAGGDVVDLVRRIHRVGFRDAAAILGGLSVSAPGPAAPVSAARSCLPEPFRPFRRALSLNHDTPFLRRKGISPGTAAAYEVGEYQGDGWLKGCVGVRVHDTAGAPLGYLGRALVPARFGRWKVPPGLPKSQLLYNYHRASAGQPAAIAVTECPWGVLRLAQLGIPAVALLGVHLSPAQHHLLTRFPRIVLLLDGDPPGRLAAARIGDGLRGAIRISIAQLPDGLDPDDLDDPTLLALIGPSFLLDQPDPRTPHRT